MVLRWCLNLTVTNEWVNICRYAYIVWSKDRVFIQKKNAGAKELGCVLKDYQSNRMLEMIQYFLNMFTSITITKILYVPAQCEIN